jgi:peptide/nickel transport system ATP-binding protein
MAGTGTAHLRPESDTLLRVEDLVVEFPAGRDKVHAVSGVSLDIRPGETLGLVGESGCGKSTTGKAIIQLPAPTSGRVRFDGAELTGLSGKGLRSVRTKLQFIFQDPISSLNPRRKVRDILAEPLRIWGRGSKREQEAKVRETLDAVGLDPDVALDKRPHQFSGGQCQRISIARALVMEPDLIICDEPVSALDVSVQAQILNLLDDLKERYDLTLVFIAHDLAVVKHVSTRVAVMYLGKICEVGDPDALYERPAHPYTQALLASIPVPDPGVRPDDADLLSGDLPSPVAPPSGCRFRTRCPSAGPRCADEEPEMREIDRGRHVACHFPVLPAGRNGDAADSERAGRPIDASTATTTNATACRLWCLVSPRGGGSRTCARRPPPPTQR